MRYPRLVFLSLLVFAVSLALSGCGGTPIAMSSNSAAPTGTPPTVIAAAEQVNGIAPNRKQEVQFSEAMDPATINVQSFQVTDSSGKLAQGTVSYDLDFETASFLPNPALQTGATYTATITTAVASTGGMHLASSYSYSFTTRSDSDTSPLIVNSVSPTANATCVSANTPIIITFDEAPDASTVNSTNIVVTGPDGAVIPVSMSINVTTTQVVLTPKSPLPSGTISVTVQNVGDLAEVMMAVPYKWSFSTACGSGGATGNEYLYVAAGVAAGTPEFYAYAIDSATGNLTPVPGMPFQAGVGATPTPCGGLVCGSLDPLADPVGRFLFYNFNQLQHGVGTMKVDPSTGALTYDDFLSLPSSSSVPPIQDISSDPQGRFVFGSGSLSAGPYGSEWISSIVVSSDGKLSFAPGEPFQYPEGTNGGNLPAPAASDKFVFAADKALTSLGADQPSKMFTFALDQTTGAMGAVHNIQDGIGAGEQVITPSGKFLYSETHAIQSSGFQGPRELTSFLVNGDGSLTPVSTGPLQLPTNDYGIHTLNMSPNGNFLYVSSIYTVLTPGVSVVTTVEIQAYAIDQNTGALSKTADYTWDTRTTDHPTGVIAIDPTVKYVYLTESISGGTQQALVGMNVDPATGALSPISGVQNWPLVSDQPRVLAIVRPQ